MKSVRRGTSLSPVLIHARRATLPAFAALTLALVGCDQAPSASGLTEWTPQDHPAAPGAQTAQPNAKPRAPVDEAAQLAELTWAAQCAQCHGPAGRGDGPSGAMVKAPDLTRAEWQDRVKDAEIVATIRAGKGQMPKFELSDAVLGGLVKRIRKQRAAP